LLLNASDLERIPFRTTHRQKHIKIFAHIIVLAKAKKAAINLGACLWARLSEDNRTKLQHRIGLKTVWWRMGIRYILGRKVQPLLLRKRSEVLEGLCLEFNCLSEIVQAAQTGLGNEGIDT